MKNSIVKVVFSGIILTIELAVCVIFSIGAVGAGLTEYKDTGYFDPVYRVLFATFLVSAVVVIGGLVRMKRGRKWVILPGILMIAAVWIISLFLFFLDGIETGLFPVSALAVLTVFGIADLKRLKDRTETPKQQPANEFSKFDRYKAEWAWEDAAKEFCELYHMSPDSLTDKENDQIYIYACNYITYLFVWLIKRDLVSPQFMEITGMDKLYELRHEKEDPALYLYEKMDGTLTRDDISQKIMKFMDSYFEESIYADGRFKRDVCYDKDYEEIVIAGSDIRWCRAFSWEVYRRMEERLDMRYHYYQVWDEFTDFDFSANESSRKIVSESLGQELDVEVADGVPEEYVERCIEHCRYLSENILKQICREIEEWGYFEEGSYEPDQFKKAIGAGSLVIPKPYGEDIAYILGFEADFEEEHGISVVIRQETVLEVGYRVDADTPWCYESEQVYRKKAAERR